MASPLSMSMVLLLSRRERGAWAASVLGMAVGLGGVRRVMLLGDWSTWELMLYYPVKALWTGMSC